MMNETLRSTRRQAMLDAIEPHSTAIQPFVDINLTAVFHDYDREDDLESFWYFLREAIEGLHNAAMIRIPNNADAHTFCRTLRCTFESAGIYGSIRVTTQTTKLRLHNRTLRFPTNQTVYENGSKKIFPAPAWEIVTTLNVAEKENAKG